MSSPDINNSNQSVNQQGKSAMIAPYSKPFRILNLPFASKKVLTDFLFYSFIIICIPVVLCYLTWSSVNNNPKYTQTEKVLLSVAPSLVIINIAIGIYIYKVINDPANYQKDEPLSQNIPVGFAEQNKNKRFQNRKKAQEVQAENKDSTNAETKNQKNIQKSAGAGTGKDKSD